MRRLPDGGTREIVRKHPACPWCPVPGAPAKKKIDGPEDLRAQIARDIAIARFFTRLRRYRAIRQHV